MDPEGWRDGMRMLFTVLLVTGALVGAVIVGTIWVGVIAVTPRSSLSGTHSPSTAHPSTGKGVHIATDPGPAPRHGGLAFLRTDLRHGGPR